MPTAALAAYGISLRIGNGVPLAPLTITGATNATPIVVTTSTAHGIADVSYATVAGVGGNTGANGTWVVSAVDATHLTLRGSVGNGAYTTGGTLTPQDTFLAIRTLEVDMLRVSRRSSWPTPCACRLTMSRRTRRTTPVRGFSFCSPVGPADISCSSSLIRSRQHGSTTPG